MANKKSQTSAGIRPLGNRVLLQAESASDEVVSGILIPTAFREKPVDHKVVAVGPQVKHLKVGDTVMVSKFAGTVIKHDNQPYTLILEDEVLAVIQQ